jgi:hypothetical protein
VSSGGSVRRCRAEKGAGWTLPVQTRFNPPCGFVDAARNVQTPSDQKDFARQPRWPEACPEIWRCTGVCSPQNGRKRRVSLHNGRTLGRQNARTTKGGGDGERADRLQRRCASVIGEGCWCFVGRWEQVVEAATQNRQATSPGRSDRCQLTLSRSTCTQPCRFAMYPRHWMDGKVGRAAA